MRHFVKPQKLDTSTFGDCNQFNKAPKVMNHRQSNESPMNTIPYEWCHALRGSWFYSLPEMVATNLEADFSLY